jgi:hypothetical protein
LTPLQEVYREILYLSYSSQGTLSRSDILDMDFTERAFHKRELVEIKKRENSGAGAGTGRPSAGRWDPGKYGG